MTGTIDRQEYPEAAWWANALERQVGSFLVDLTEMAPWIKGSPGSLDSELHSRELDIPRAIGMLELAALARPVPLVPNGTPASANGDFPSEMFQLGAERIVSRIQQIEDLSRRCEKLTEAEFSFLYSEKRKLLTIGYWVTDRRLDNSYYDLLASEARLASYVAIASGQIPFDHLVRSRAEADDRAGSAGAPQLEWIDVRIPDAASGDARLPRHTPRSNIPCGGFSSDRIRQATGSAMGISEFCYNVMDLEGTYQYRAFGVPGLGFAARTRRRCGHRSVCFRPGIAGRSKTSLCKSATYGVGILSRAVWIL